MWVTGKNQIDFGGEKLPAKPATSKLGRTIVEVYFEGQPEILEYMLCGGKEETETSSDRAIPKHHKCRRVKCTYPERGRFAVDDEDKTEGCQSLTIAVSL